MMISRFPCEACDDSASDEVGAGYCRRTNTGDFECDVRLQANEIYEIGVRMVPLVRRVEDEAMRRELAEGVASGLDNALWKQGHGARFNEDFFINRCLLPVEDRCPD